MTSRRNCLHGFFAEWGVAVEESGEKQLWEENWDDDDVEDDFSRQLRCVIT